MLLKLDSYFKSYHISFCCRDSVKLTFHINHKVSGALPRHLSCICNYSSAFYRNHWDKFPPAKQKEKKKKEKKKSCGCVFNRMSVGLRSLLIRFCDTLLLLLNNN